MKSQRVSAEAIASSECPCRSAMTLSEVLRTDLARCMVLSERAEGRIGPGALLRALVLYPGFYGVAAYRVAHAALHAPVPALVRPFLYAAALVLRTLVITVTKVEISARAHIGPGLLVNHAQGVVVGPVVAGSNLTLSHFASIGMGGNAAQPDAEELPDAVVDQHSPEGRCPTLGDRVWIGVGAVLGGEIVVGDDAMVGANAVVGSDLPERAVAVGAPARVTSYRGSFGFVHYRGMLSDQARIRSLAAAQDAVTPRPQSGNQTGHQTGNQPGLRHPGPVPSPRGRAK